MIGAAEDLCVMLVVANDTEVDADAFATDFATGADFVEVFVDESLVDPCNTRNHPCAALLSHAETCRFEFHDIWRCVV
jgi:hypothetical protein